MRKRNRSAAALLLALSVVLLMSGCGKKAEPKTISQLQTAQETMPEPEKPAFTDPLTGLPCEETVRMTHPIAIMINNHHRALPQAGVSRAGVVYECMTEGSITRMLAVFNDYADIEKIGAVRSARHYFLDLAGNHGAYYIHYGGSPQAYQSIRTNDVQALDGLSGLDTVMFYRDKQRLKKGRYMLEHSAFTTGEKITKGLNYKKYDSMLTVNPQDAFHFAEEEYTPEGQAAAKVIIPYGPYITPYYTYDKTEKVYKRWEFKEKHIDSLTGKQLAFKNLLVLYVPQRSIKDDTSGRLDVTVTGTGEGVYFTNGVAVPITFKKLSMQSPIKYYGEDGKELSVNAGKTFINLVSNRLEVKIQE